VRILVERRKGKKKNCENLAHNFSREGKRGRERKTGRLCSIVYSREYFKGGTRGRTRFRRRDNAKTRATGVIIFSPLGAVG